MFKIGEFSKLASITVKMLRHYDTIDLLKPEVIDGQSNYRYYSAVQLDIANQINLYKSMGFTLKEIKILLKEDGEALQDYFRAKELDLSEELNQLKRRMMLLEKAKATSEKRQALQYHAVEKIIPERLVLSCRGKVPSYHDERLLWNKLYETLETNQLIPIYDGYTMAIYHDPEYHDDEADIEVQVTIKEGREVAGDCQVRTVKAQQIISVTFAGSYDQMPKVNQALAFKLEHEDCQLTGPMINIFHVSPAQAQNESEYVTESCYLIKKRGEENG